MDAEHLAPVATKVVGVLGTSLTWPALFTATLNLLVGGALVALIKKWPDLKKVAADRANSLDDERRADMGKLSERITVLESKVESANSAANEARNAAHIAEMRLVSAVAAVTLLAAVVRAKDPDNPALKQAQDLIAAATAGDLGFGRGLADLAAFSATQREGTKS